MLCTAVRYVRDPSIDTTLVLLHTINDVSTLPVAPVVQSVTSKPSDVGTSVRISAQSHELGFSLTSCPTSGERSCRGFPKFDVTVDEGKGRLNLSRDKRNKASIAEERWTKKQTNLCGLPPV